MDTNSEQTRLKALQQYNVLDTPPEDEFNNIVQLASQICQAPISLVSLIDQDRQWFKAKTGLSVAETPRSMAFCAHAIEQEEVMVVEDTLKDERFVHNPLVTGNPDIRFYAGAPLITPEGHSLGTLCVIDRVPRQLSPEQSFALSTLAKQVMTQLELRRTIKQLNEIVATKNKLLSIISHDLKSPLLSIQMLLELFLEEKISPVEMRSVALRMQQAVLSTDNLLKNLTDWFISELAYGGLRVTQVNLSALLERKVTRMYPQFREKNNRLINKTTSEYTLEADENMLTFIFRNLLENANKYTQDGEISIDTAEDAQQLHITIIDTGIGMSQKQQDQLFDWQLHKSTFGTANERGHGLGLLLVKEFVEKHYGTLELQSHPNQGTSIRVTLPKLHIHTSPQYGLQPQ